MTHSTSGEPDRKIVCILSGETAETTMSTSHGNEAAKEAKIRKALQKQNDKDKKRVSKAMKEVNGGTGKLRRTRRYPTFLKVVIVFKTAIYSKENGCIGRNRRITTQHISYSSIRKGMRVSDIWHPIDARIPMKKQAVMMINEWKSMGQRAEVRSEIGMGKDEPGTSCITRLVLDWHRSDRLTMAYAL